MRRRWTRHLKPAVGLGWILRSSIAAIGLVLLTTASLAFLSTGWWSADAEAAAQQILSDLPEAAVALEEWEYSTFLPLLITNRPLRSEERYGFVALSSTWRQQFDVEQLGAGWYVDVNAPACATSPGGMDRALLIRVRDWNANPRWSWLEAMVDAYPGALWLVGNEPDCVWQDGLLPEDYAHIYHEIHTAIKTQDTGALVSPGGIVQPTPLRLAWLDRVLQEYAVTYGGTMPVDVWNIHNAILLEVNRDCDPKLYWGADIPPGFDECVGEWRDLNDNDNIDIFKQQIWDFRAWMVSRGYGGYPLIITEFGVLLPVELGYDLARVNAFMDATFDFLATATSNAPETLGDPSDEYHLVQRWAWYSLDDIPYDMQTNEGFNGNLFDPVSTDITEFGLNYALHTSAFPPLEYVDLHPGSLWFEPLDPAAPGEQVDLTVHVEVQNLGSLPASAFVVRLEYDGNEGGPLQQAVSGLAAGSSDWIEFELIGLPAGAYTILVSVDPDAQVSEVTECDNEGTYVMVVPADVAYLPLISRRH